MFCVQVAAVVSELQIDYIREESCHLRDVVGESVSWVYNYATIVARWSFMNSADKVGSCACDVPAHNYTFSWEPSIDASAVYVSSRELFEYFQNFAEKYDLNKYIHLEQQVVGTKWNGDSWDVEISNRKDGHTYRDQCDILINATGILNNWRWPDVPGLNDFKGSLLHSANWSPDISLDGKTVGLIGNG